MTAAELLDFALHSNLHVVRVEHLKCLATKYDIPFIDVRRAARNADITTLTLSETYVGRVGYEPRLQLFANAHDAALTKPQEEDLLLDDKF